jgi:hypothetical protein
MVGRLTLELSCGRVKSMRARSSRNSDDRPAAATQIRSTPDARPLHAVVRPKQSLLEILTLVSQMRSQTSQLAGLDSSRQNSIAQYAEIS